MGNDNWRNVSIKVFLVLFCVSILCLSFSFLGHNNVTGKDLVENTDLQVGKTVFAGDLVLSENEVVKVPLISNFGFLSQQILNLDLNGIIVSLSTGTVPVPTTEVASEGISSSGAAIGFEGPGYLTMDGENLAVKGPENFVWGIIAPYKVLTKTDKGLNIVENGEVTGFIPEDQIRSTDFQNEEFNSSDIANWYNKADVGRNFTLENGLSYFSDNRSALSAEEVNSLFGEETLEYLKDYPIGSPVMVYAVNYTEVSGNVFATNLGSFPNYGDHIREENTQQFVKAWNNTIIPPGASANGKSNSYFGLAPDPEAPGGAAAHGVCPPGRVLRDAAFAEGFGMPVGMQSGDEAISIGYNPAVDIKVTNNHDFPVKIVMWVEGSGPGLTIYGKFVRMEPNK